MLGKQYPLEMRVDFQNEETKDCGVLSILYALRKKQDNNLEPILEMIPLVSRPTGNVPFKSKMNISKLLPPVWDIFRYAGSWTSPPCYENVLWSVFVQRQGITQDQLDKFKGIQGGKGIELKNTNRSLQKTLTSTRKIIYSMHLKRDDMYKAAF